MSVPTINRGPRLIGSAKVGSAVTVDPGVWSGQPAPTIALQWGRDGAAIRGATGASYTPVAGDDRKALSCKVIATNSDGRVSAKTAEITVTRVAPVAGGTLADVSLAQGAVAGSVPAAPAFTGDGLIFAVSGAGATVNASGVVSIPTATLVSGATVTVTASNSGGSASVGFKVTVRAANTAPAVTTAPKLTGAGKVGSPVTVDPGVWSGQPAPTTALQWQRDGVAISGATGASYTPVAADDRKALTCKVTATNAAGSATATTAALAITRVAPVASGSLADVSLLQSAAAGSVPAAPAFTGDDLSFAVSGAGATVNASGVVSIPTATLVSGATVTVTASNSGGSASVGFKVTVRAANTAPAVTTAPKLTGAGKVGSPVTVDPGVWSGQPAPTTALQWQRDGVAISGATGASYTPVAADDRKALTCKVTATNAAGSATATTAALAITRVAPVASGSLADVSLLQGAAAGSVPAAPAFTGDDLSFAVSGAGATVNAAGVVSIPTATLVSGATVTVTASNSGGSASVGFKVTVSRPSTDPNALIGTTTQDMNAVAIAAPFMVGRDDNSTNYAYHGPVLQALGMAALTQGRANAANNAVAAGDRLIAQLQNMFGATGRNPPMGGGFTESENILVMHGLVALRYSSRWNDLPQVWRDRFTLVAKVGMISGAVVCSPNMPWTRPRTLRGGDKQHLWNSSPNFPVQPPGMVLSGAAFLGGITQGLNFLNTLNMAALVAELDEHAAALGRVRDTARWSTLNMPVNDGWNDGSSRAPTYAQIQAGVRNLTFQDSGVPFTNYSRILAGMTHDIGVAARPVFDGIIHRGRNNGAGVPGTGTAPDGQANLGRQPTGTANPPGLGQVGGANELYLANDGGQRSTMGYAMLGVRSLVGTWLSMAIAGMIDTSNPDIAAAIPVLNRGMADMKHKDGTRYFNYSATGNFGGTWPVANDSWGRHRAGQAFNSQPGGGYLFELYFRCLAPRLGV